MSAATRHPAVQWLRDHVPSAAHLTTDSRTLGEGDVFLAYPGHRVDGRRFAADAVARGAAALIWDPVGDVRPEAAWRAPVFFAENLKQSAGAIAAGWYGNPSARLVSVGVTGTSGKSSSALWIAQAFDALGRRAAVVGTLGAGFTQALNETGLTTPDPVEVQRLLADLVRQGAQVLAMEVSSIGLEEGRVEGMHFDVALFCNLTRDHLDYHGSLEAYEEAKARLFAWPDLRYAVVNHDDAAGRRMARVARSYGVTVVEFGMAADASLTLAAEDIELRADGMRFKVRGAFGVREVATALLGRYNVANLLGVLGVLLACDVGIDDALAAMQNLRPAPGRLERVAGARGPVVIVDYAHKPDALEKVLEACRPLAAAGGGRLAVVFGCGGDRDPGKRPLMGEIAARLADTVYITNDNPRSEDAATIAAAIVAGTASGRATVLVELDRRAAIGRAIQAAGPSDVVLIAGKGHETYQEIRGVKTPFSDSEVARELLSDDAALKAPLKAPLKAGPEGASC